MLLVERDVVLAVEGCDDCRMLVSKSCREHLRYVIKSWCGGLFGHPRVRTFRITGLATVQCILMSLKPYFKLGCIVMVYGVMASVLLLEDDGAGLMMG